MTIVLKHNHQFQILRPIASYINNKGMLQIKSDKSGPSASVVIGKLIIASTNLASFPCRVQKMSEVYMVCDCQYYS